MLCESHDEVTPLQWNSTVPEVPEAGDGNHISPMVGTQIHSLTKPGFGHSVVVYHLVSSSLF